MPNDNSNKLVTLADLKVAYDDLNSGKKSVQATISDPTAEGNAVSFIDSITQDASGVITATKKTIPDATTSASGLMTATDKTNLENTVPKTGGTFTGGLSITGATTGLTVSYEGGTAIKVNDTIRGHSIELRSWSDRKQGLWTPGYASDSAYNSVEKWLIYRDKDGKVHVGDHYSAEEVDAKLANLRLMRVTIIKDDNNADITIPAGNTQEGVKSIAIDLKKYNYIGDGIRIYDAVSAWLGAWRLPYIADDGIVKTWISRLDQNKTFTITNLVGAWPLSTYPLYLTLLVY